MKVILLDEIPSLGKPGDIVDVSDGYGRNYLIPKKLAVKSTDKSIKKFEHEKRVINSRLNKEKSKAEELAKEIENLNCVIYRQVGEQEKLFGSVTSKDIAEYLGNEGFKIDKKRIILDEPIKFIGSFNIPIKLYPEVVANLKMNVEKK